MRYALLYWLCFGVVGATMLAQNLPDLLAGGRSVSTVVTSAASALIVLATLAGLRNPEDSGAPTDPGPLLYLMVVAAALSVGSLLLA